MMTKTRLDFKLLTTISLVLGLCCITLKGQTNPLNFSLQHIKTGMSQNSVTIIYEDSSDYLWIGTQNGINKYDGTKFEIFETTLDSISGLTNGYIRNIYEDNNGLLYIGTNQGLNTFNRDLNRVEPYKFINEGKDIESKIFNSVIKTGDYLWFGTNNNGVYKYNIDTGALHKLALENLGLSQANGVLDISVVDNKTLLVTTNERTFIINNKLQIIKSLEEKHKFSGIHKVNNTHYFLGTNDGTLLDLKINKKKTFEVEKTLITPGYPILSITKDDNEVVWIGSENNGLFLLDLKTTEVENFKEAPIYIDGLSSNSIWSLYKTKNGVVWIGPFKNGLSFYDTNFYKFNHIKNNPFDSKSLNNNIVNCFSEDEKGNMWIGTDGGGLEYWNRTTDSFEHFNNKNGKLNTDVIISLLQEKNNKLWIGSWANGLTILDLKTKKYEVWNRDNSFLQSNNILAIHKDKKGRIWIAELFGGLHVYFPTTGLHKTIEVPSNKEEGSVTSFYKIEEDKKGNIWVGTATDGIFKITENIDDWSIKQYSTLNKERRLSNDFVNTIIQDSNNTIWVGTQAGLNKYNAETDSFEFTSKLHGLRNDDIKGIISDKNKWLWLSTGNGLTHYDPTTKKIINYDVIDGLQSNEFNAGSFYETKKGELVFGGSNGFNTFDPSQIHKRKDTPTLVISGLKIFNEEVRPNDNFKVLSKHISQVDSLTFSYEHSSINLEFNAITYYNPSNVQYAYFMEGFEKDWNYVGQKKSATYTNLNPGEYIFRLKSSNSDGVWNDKEKILHITIPPPFWETIWFKILVTSLILLSIYIAIRIKVKKIKKYQIILEEKINQRTAELRQQKKKLQETANALELKNEEIQRFAFAVSHDLKSPLSGIKGIANIIPMEMTMTKFPELEKYLEMINISCDTMSNLIADITQIARLGKVENKYELLDTKKIMELSKILVKGKLKTSNVKLKIVEELPVIYGDKNRFIQIFGNLLDNAIKYMGEQENPTVEVFAEEIGDKITFSVKDNGSGMSEKHLKKLFTPFQRFHANVTGTGLGLYMVKQIVESHNGTIEALSEGEGMGTTFTITLPHSSIAIEKATERIQATLEQNQ